MQLSFQIWIHSVRKQKCCNRIFFISKKIMIHSILIYTNSSIPRFSIDITFIKVTFDQQMSMPRCRCLLALILDSWCFAAEFCIFNRNFIIHWKQQFFVISTLKTQHNALNAFVKLSLQHTLNFREKSPDFHRYIYYSCC